MSISQNRTMLLHEFPNLTWLKEKINQRFGDGIDWDGKVLESRGWPTVLLNVQAKSTVRDQVKGPLSIFTNLKGSSFVGTDQTRAKLTEDTFFVSNADQLYTLEIDQPVETFNIHIGEKLSEEVLYDCMHEDSYLIDHPEVENKQTPNFYNKLYRKTPLFKGIVTQLSTSVSKTEEQELLGSLVDHLIAQTHQLKKQEQSLNTRKESTRKEILKRLFLATDYIYSHYQNEILLEELSQISCLSKFHFLRVFKSIFRETPHQFITRLRIEKAKEYLKEKSLTVKDVAHKVGFADASSFSRSFKNKVGNYPIQFIA